MKMIYRTKRLFGDVCIMAAALLTLALALVSCDDHEFFDSNVHPGHVLCSDGSVLSQDEFFAQDRVRAEGVVFSDVLDDGTYLAVLLQGGYPKAFCDSVGMVLGTSGSLTELDGFANTSSMQNSYSEKTGHGSPLALSVFSSHVYGQSDFIPSVAEIRRLYAARHTVNGVLERLKKMEDGQGRLLYAVDLLDLSGESGAWYWTSTEVLENKGMQAWLFSMASGVIHETPKTEAHPYRAVVRVHPYNVNSN